MKIGIIQLGLINLIITTLIIFGIYKLIKCLIKYNTDYKIQQEKKEKEKEIIYRKYDKILDEIAKDIEKHEREQVY